MDPPRLSKKRILAGIILSYAEALSRGLLRPQQSMMARCLIAIWLSQPSVTRLTDGDGHSVA